MKKIISAVVVILFLSFINACSPSGTCSDNQQNQSETGVDCGGPCTNCPTCIDGIQNQNEPGVDCGGPCPACVSCTDGIQNQGETAIDCGGPCANCAIIYPMNGLYGPDVFRNDTITLKGMTTPVAQPSYKYSLCANLPANGLLKVKITSLSGGVWSIYGGTQTGWAIGNFQNNAQEFNASGQVNCDVQIFLKNSGSALIEFFEYGATTPTRTKQISWSL
ncbi:hypothetical protein CNR22_22455 [Sphingobacteriaceae bacterium]|nr:hypothetical protein CNR22_22455 [Sphingobacteriaceae bacterium]